MAAYVRFGRASAVNVERSDALRSLVNFARLRRTDGTRSGFVAYDLGQLAAERAGHLEVISPLSFLVPGLLGGRVSWTDVDYVIQCPDPDAEESPFNVFVRMLARIPNQDLHDLDDLAPVIDLCGFGVKAVRAAKVTKVGHFYRPRTVPILDREVSKAFGFGSSGLMHNPSNQASVVRELADQIGNQLAALMDLRNSAARYVRGFEGISVLRIADLIIWTRHRDLYHQKEIGEPPTTPEILDSALRWLPAR